MLLNYLKTVILVIAFSHSVSHSIAGHFDQLQAILFSNSPDKLSILWPDHVSLTRKIELTSGQEFKVGSRAVLTRITENGAILDFGRSGIHEIPLENTDIYDQMRHLLLGAQKRHGLFTKRYANKLFISEEAKYRSLDHQDVPGKYYMLYFSDFSSVSSLSLVGYLASHKEDYQNHSINIVICPLNDSEEDYLEILKEHQWYSPAMFHWYAPSFINTLHDISVSESTCIIFDDEGRIVSEPHPVPEKEITFDIVSADIKQQVELYTTLSNTLQDNEFTTEVLEKALQQQLELPTR